MIEPNFFVKGFKINPDVILTTKKYNHSIVIDCKSSTIKKNQLEKYRKMKNNPRILVQRGIANIIDRNQFFLDMVLSSFKDLSGSQIGNDFSLVKFETENNNLKRLSTYEGHEFNFGKLNNVFPIEFDVGYKIPTDFYPFDTHEDDEIQFQVSFLQSLQYVALNQETFDEENVLRDAHPMWELISDSKKKEFRRKADAVMGEFRKRGLDRYLGRVKDSRKKEWRLSSRTFRSFQSKCQELIDSIRKDQSRLYDFVGQDEEDGENK